MGEMLRDSRLAEKMPKKAENNELSSSFSSPNAKKVSRYHPAVWNQKKGHLVKQGLGSRAERGAMQK